jgi:hypothetical protein
MGGGISTECPASTAPLSGFRRCRQSLGWRDSPTRRDVEHSPTWGLAYPDIPSTARPTVFRANLCDHLEGERQVCQNPWEEMVHTGGAVGLTRMLTRVAALIAILVSPSRAQSPELPFGIGERLRYRVTVNGLGTVGEGEMSVRQRMS